MPAKFDEWKENLGLEYWAAVDGVKMLSENIEHVAWYMRSASAIEHLEKEGHNPNYISSAEFDVSRLQLSNDMNTIIEASDILIFAIPSVFLEGELKKLTASLSNKIVFSAIKGIVPESGLIVGEHFHDVYEIPFKNIGVLPC